ncbi:hypothetical protein ACIQH5_14665 [Paenarthrobacter sp. NPDC091711]|uniref:hypothetical protein n=1 Tax=Paenarthrobacter sp. NPDC091711 TaxID=3364385 RepID=UPI00382C1948
MNDPSYIVLVPRDESSRLELLATRPPVWEYLLFAAFLYEGLQRTEPKWRDYSLGIAPYVGPQIDLEELPNKISDLMSRAGAIVSNLEKLFAPVAQEAAFGAPGEPGDPDFIEHIANRVVDMYEGLLDWAAEVRSLRVAEQTRDLLEIAASFVKQPIEDTRGRVKDFIAQLETAMDRVAKADEEPIELSLPLILTVDPEIPKALEAELRRILLL